MKALWVTLLDRKEELFKALMEHLSISFFALLLACVIAIPLGIYFSYHKKGAEGMLQLTSVLQTIPSLALLGLLLPIVGIGTPPALIALVAYAILPIFQNTYTGLTSIDASLVEAAEAFGMNRFQKLKKIELPLALPMIISGIRTALVMIIGTATLAALIGAGGLGTFILLGIDRNYPMLTFIGAISAALLAILASSLLYFLQKRSSKLALSVIGILTICIGSFSFLNASLFSPQSVVIAGKLGSEPDLLIEMYKALIQQEKRQTTVVLKPNFGKTSFLFNALKHNQIDIYPEFTGTVLTSLVKNETIPQTPEKTYALANQLLKEQFNMTLLNTMKYENTYALAVTKEVAATYNLKRLSDLKEVQDQLVAGFTLEFADRKDGYLGLKEKEQLFFKEVKTMEPSLRYQALVNQEVAIIDAYSTDSEIKQYDLVVLKDDLNYFPSYRGAPLVLESFKKKHPNVVKALNRLENKITEKDMIQMNYDVQVKKQSAKDVALRYLKENHLLEDKK